MVTRHYICNNCGYQSILVESIHDVPKQQCPQCQGSLFQDLTGQIHIVKQITTLGQQAEKNAREMGKYGVEDRQKEEKSEFEKRKLKSLQKMGTISKEATEIPEVKPWYNPTGTNLKKKLKSKLKDKSSIKKYILEGK